MKTALAIRHVSFEDLGLFRHSLEAAGYRVRYHDIGVHPLAGLDPLAPDLLIVLGGPIGVHDISSYPFLEKEMGIIGRRVALDHPTMGLCLGAQLIATVLGARIEPMTVKEIGFAPVTMTEKGRRGALRHLDGLPVLHWHADMFAVPKNASLLAGSAICENQAFARGDNIIGLQFHAEICGDQIERWLIGHACELAASKIDVPALRADAARYDAAVRDAGRSFVAEWLAGISARQDQPAENASDIREHSFRVQ